FEDFTAKQIHDAAKDLRRIFWDSLRSYLRPELAAKPERKGGFGMPTLEAVYRVMLVKNNAQIIAHIDKTTHWAPPNTIREPQSDRHNDPPDWITIIMESWRTRINRRTHDRLPKGLSRAFERDPTKLLFDPYFQFANCSRLTLAEWPPVLYKAYMILRDNRYKYGASLDRDALQGNPLFRPLLSTP
ncbi:hypothetical protein IWW36_004513, partial [Coemansia brasiliensis]